MTEPIAEASSGAFAVPLRPPRKRRRPALSCVQCRRRKVKCDRKMPCSQCTQYNNTVCEYEDPEVHARTRGSTTHTIQNNSSTLPLNQSHDVPVLRESILFNTTRTIAPPVAGTRSPTASVSWGTAPRTEFSRPEQQPSESSIGAGIPQPEPSVQELKERVRKLEAIVSRSINYAQSPFEHESYVPTTNVPKFRGNIHKS